MIEFILLFLLLVIAIIDWKFKSVPSIFLTGLLFVVAMVNFVDFNWGVFHLSMGAMAFIFAWLLYEGQFISGIADVKVLSIIGLMINSIPMFFVFVLVTLLMGMSYKLIFRFILKKDQFEEIPFIPALVCVYIVLFLIGGVA